MQVRNQFSQQPKVAGEATVLHILMSTSLYDKGGQTLMNDHNNSVLKLHEELQS